MTKDAYYFSHDSNARNDENIVDMRMALGWEGYGIYWAIVELLRDAPGHKMKTDFGKIAFTIGGNVSKDVVASVIDDWGLFRVDGDMFWSDSLNRRMKKANDSRKKRVQAGRKGGLSNARAMPERGSTKERKGKERKRKEKKELPQAAMRLAGLLVESIKKVNPNYTGPDDLSGWAGDIDRLMRINGATEARIEKVILWLPTSNFWCRNIMSGAKLRKQFDRLEIDMVKPETSRRQQETNWAQHSRPLLEED